MVARSARRAPQLGLALALALPVACSVRDLPSVGRTCAGQQPCGPGTVCDPQQLICVAQLPDARVADGAVIDAAADAGDAAGGPRSELACHGVESVGDPLPAGGLFEPALRTDGLRLVARAAQGEPYQTTRTSIDAPFGAWAVATDLPARVEDPAFFLYKQQEYLVSTSQSEPRHLMVCPGGADCQAVSIVDSDGTSITDDIDGPAVADPDGLPLMVFNVAVVAVSGSADIYQARPTSFDFRTWLAVPLTRTQLGPGVDEDDPGINADGTIVVFGDRDDLWVARRASIGAPFAPPERVSGAVNTADQEAAPFLAPLGDGRLELFYASNGGDGRRIRRATCQP